jgi:hypothetical protein
MAAVRPAAEGRVVLPACTPAWHAEHVSNASAPCAVGSSGAGATAHLRCRQDHLRQGASCPWRDALQTPRTGPARRSESCPRAPARGRPWTIPGSTPERAGRVGLQVQEVGSPCRKAQADSCGQDFAPGASAAPSGVGQPLVEQPDTIPDLDAEHRPVVPVERLRHGRPALRRVARPRPVARHDESGPRGQHAPQFGHLVHADRAGLPQVVQVGGKGVARRQAGSVSSRAKPDDTSWKTKSAYAAPRMASTAAARRR